MDDEMLTGDSSEDSTSDLEAQLIGAVTTVASSAVAPTPVTVIKSTPANVSTTKATSMTTWFLIVAAVVVVILLVRK